MHQDKLNNTSGPCNFEFRDFVLYRKVLLLKRLNRILYQQAVQKALMLHQACFVLKEKVNIRQQAPDS